MNKIYSFKPYAKSVIWGGDALVCLKHLPANLSKIGETWEISSVPGHESELPSGVTLPMLIDEFKGALVGNKVYEKFGHTFPLLIKFIDAKADLSVQVHPNDELAMKRHNSFGKTEMWYVMATVPGAKIISGLSESIDKAEYKRLIETNRITDVLAAHDSHPGDVFFLPAGRIHAIGAGNLLLEIQQTSDITYRVYDYDRRDADGNPRQLHTEEAADAIDYTVYPEYRTSYNRDAKGITPLVHCPYFNVDKITVDGSLSIPMPLDSFLTISCVEGEGEIVADGETQPIAAGHTVLVAASTGHLQATGKMALVTSSL